jgi:hypothetical protein
MYFLRIHGQCYEAPDDATPDVRGPSSTAGRSSDVFVALVEVQDHTV